VAVPHLDLIVAEFIASVLPQICGKTRAEFSRQVGEND
jgi:hypothetical protein